MKTLKINKEELIKETVLSKISDINHLLLIKGLGWGDFCLLQLDGHGKWVWFQIGTHYGPLGKYRIDLDNEWDFDSREEAVLHTALAEKEIFEFENLGEMVDWLLVQEDLRLKP